MSADEEKPTLLSLAAHLGFPLETLWREAAQKAPDCGVSDPFTAPLLQLRHEIGTHLRRDFEMHKNATKIHQGSIYHPDNRLYGVLVFAFVVLCHRLHESEEANEQVVYDDLHKFDRGNESPLFPLFSLCWLFAVEDMIAHGKTENAKTLLNNIMISFRRKKPPPAKPGEAEKKQTPPPPEPVVPPVLRVMVLRALFYVTANPEARDRIGADLQRATEVLSAEEVQIINARARHFAAVNQPRE